MPITLVDITRTKARFLRGEPEMLGVLVTVGMCRFQCLLSPYKMLVHCTQILLVHTAYIRRDPAI